MAAAARIGETRGTRAKVSDSRNNSVGRKVREQRRGIILDEKEYDASSLFRPGRR